MSLRVMFCVKREWTLEKYNQLQQVICNHLDQQNDLQIRYCTMAQCNRLVLHYCPIITSPLRDWCDDFWQTQASRVFV
jgi:hypothetical protein